MDPSATLARIGDCIAYKDYSGAVEALAAYYQWRVRGGFEPTEGDKRASVLAARLCDVLEVVS